MKLGRWLKGVFEFGEEVSHEENLSPEAKRDFFMGMSIKEETNPADKKKLRIASSTVPGNVPLDDWMKGGYSKAERDYKFNNFNKSFS